MTEKAQFRVQRRMCSTCIYRGDLPPSFLAALESQVADPAMRGHFKGFRECHHTDAGSAICCRGFWEAHRENCTPLQLAMRLDIVQFVDIDNEEEQ